MESFRGIFLSPNEDQLEFNLQIMEKLSESNFEIELRKIIKPLLYSHYLDLVLNEYTHQELYNICNDGNEISTEELEKIVWEIDKPKYTCVSLHKIYITCWGCQNNILNQEGHMDYGGCLYQSSED